MSSCKEISTLYIILYKSELFNWIDSSTIVHYKGTEIVVFLEQWPVIKFWVDEGEKQTSVHEYLLTV